MRKLCHIMRYMSHCETVIVSKKKSPLWHMHCIMRKSHFVKYKGIQLQKSHNVTRNTRNKVAITRYKAILWDINLQLSVSYNFNYKN